MQLKSVKSLLSHWHEIAQDTQTKVNVTLPIPHEDWVRIQAFATTYNVTNEQIIQDIFHESLNELEASIPYIPGPTVIRVEDGDPIYEDVGLMPRYLKAKKEFLKH